MSAAADRLLRAKFDLGFTEYLLLHGVGNKHLTNQTELAGFVGVSDAGVSRIVGRLASRGLLTARVNPTNRRRSLLTLTPKGGKLLQQASTHIEQRFGKSAGSVASRDDLAVFERVLDAVLTKVESKP